METEMSGVLRYRRNPRPEYAAQMAVAKYSPGGPLDALTEVARMTGRRAELIEAALPSETVLLVRWYRDTDEGSEVEWEVIRAGDYLAYRKSSMSLGGTDDGELEQFYERDSEAT